MLNKRITARALLPLALVVPLAVVAGCETTATEEQSARIDGALSEVNRLRAEVADAKSQSQRAAEAAERAAMAAERAAEEAKAAADKADRIFQRQMRK